MKYATNSARFEIGTKSSPAGTLPLGNTLDDFAEVSTETTSTIRNFWKIVINLKDARAEYMDWGRWDTLTGDLHREFQKRKAAGYSEEESD